MDCPSEGRGGEDPVVLWKPGAPGNLYWFSHIPSPPSHSAPGGCPLKLHTFGLRMGLVEGEIGQESRGRGGVASGGL